MSQLLLGLVCILGLGADDLRQRVEALIAESGGEVAVAFRALEAGPGSDELLIAPDEVFHAASTMKIPVMLELFRQAHAGELSLDDTLVIDDEFSSIVDGSPYRLSAEDDSDQEIYQHLGEPRSLRALCEGMIVVSSNLATNLLIEHLGVERIRQTVSALGAEGMSVVRGVEDIKAYEAGRSNTTTARALLVLLEALARGKAVSAEADREMIAVLERQRFADGIPAGVPDGTRVAHKTGNITAIHHDAGIVWAPRPFVIVVLVRGVEDEARSARLIADVTREVHRASQGAGR
ncbi:MAG TPA: serine hydrolase [Thermoanaerobaculia bacterium]|nr:serine hydrolase [Thermoanaerobaculia bacterium]